MHKHRAASIHPASQSCRKDNSSTDFRPRQRSTWLALAAAARRFSSESGEVALLTMASSGSDLVPTLAASHAWMTERNESVSARIIPIRNPNGKDKRNSGAGLLLMTPNTSEIIPFADELRQQSFAADEQVMDRGAEGAAGGYDAI